MKTRIHQLKKDGSKKQKIINNLKLLLYKQEVDNKLTSKLKKDLEAARQRTRKYKNKHITTTEVRFACTQ
jgi:alpha-D-ribose 1-methylphosphonate 5-triphosphate synthase subunit PhnG